MLLLEVVRVDIVRENRGRNEQGSKQGELSHFVSFPTMFGPNCVGETHHPPMDATVDTRPCDSITPATGHIACATLRMRLQSAHYRSRRHGPWRVRTRRSHRSTGSRKKSVVFVAYRSIKFSQQAYKATHPLRSPSDRALGLHRELHLTTRGPPPTTTCTKAPARSGSAPASGYYKKPTAREKSA